MSCARLSYTQKRICIRIRTQKYGIILSLVWRFFLIIRIQNVSGKIVSKYTMRFKSYERFHYLTTTSWNDAQQSKKDGKDQERIHQVPHLTQDTTWESSKNIINITNKSEEVSPFREGDHKAAMNRRESTKNKRHKKHKWSTKEVPPWNGQ